MHASARRLRFCRSATCCRSQSRPTSPAASASVSPSAEPSFATRRSFCSTSPCRDLDAELRVSMRVELARLHRRLKATMLYVTHDQTEAMTLADKIVVMRDGEIEQTGTPEQLYDDPDNIFVAGFIGSPQMNFISAEASGGTLRLRLRRYATLPTGFVGGRYSRYPSGAYGAAGRPVTDDRRHCRHDRVPWRNPLSVRPTR